MSKLSLSLVLCAFLALQWHFSPVKAAKECGAWQFQCKSSGECIYAEDQCNGVKNCPDGSDEDNCEIAECCRACFKCKDGSCIKSDNVCGTDSDKYYKRGCYEPSQCVAGSKMQCGPFKRYNPVYNACILIGNNEQRCKFDERRCFNSQRCVKIDDLCQPNSNACGDDSTAYNCPTRYNNTGCMLKDLEATDMTDLISRSSNCSGNTLISWCKDQSMMTGFRSSRYAKTLTYFEAICSQTEWQFITGGGDLTSRSSLTMLIASVVTTMWMLIIGIW